MMVVPTVQHFLLIHQYIVSSYLMHWVTNGTPCPVRMDWDMDLRFVVIWHITPDVEDGVGLWNMRVEVFIAVLLKMHVTMGAVAPNVSKALRPFKISGIMCQTIQHHVLEDFFYFSILCISVGTKHTVRTKPTDSMIIFTFLSSAK